jgi:hypothetical protein
MGIAYDIPIYSSIYCFQNKRANASMTTGSFPKSRISGDRTDKEMMKSNVGIIVATIDIAWLCLVP